MRPLEIKNTSAKERERGREREREREEWSKRERPNEYGVATSSRLLQIVGLFCRM